MIPRRRWSRVEPWSTLFTDLDTTALLGVADGRDNAAFRAALHPLTCHTRASLSTTSTS